VPPPPSPSGGALGHRFGRDDELRAALEPFDIRSWAVGSIATETLRRDHSSDLGLLYDALAGAITRQRPLQVRRGGDDKLLTIDPAHASDPLFGPYALP